MIDGGQIFAIASVALGGAAMVSALIVRNQIKRKQLDKKLAYKNEMIYKINTIPKNTSYIFLFYIKKQ